MFAPNNNGLTQTASGMLPWSVEAVEPAWGNLDIWPESNWHRAAPTATAMLRLAIDLQINRLFWPEQFLPEPPADALPHHMARIMRSRLKAIVCYDAV